MDTEEELIQCTECNEFFDEDEIIYFDEDGDEDWYAVCETCAQN